MKEVDKQQQQQQQQQQQHGQVKHLVRSRRAFWVYTWLAFISCMTDTSTSFPSGTWTKNTILKRLIITVIFRAVIATAVAILLYYYIVL